MEEFKTKTVGTKNCDGPVTGTPHASYDYIVRSTSGDDEYPTDACPRYLQVNGKFDNLQVTANVQTATMTASGTVTAPTFVGNLTGVASGNKVLAAFDIPHVKDKNKRIRHIVAEGPEPGIYIRGKLKDTNVIELPEYWDGLIDPETITVTLTQIGYSQDLIVEKIEWGKKVIVKSGTGANIDCYYVIHGARIDGEPLIVEYEGETPAQYPGSDDQYSISGYDYGRKN